MSHHGRGNHPCPLCDTAPLQTSVTEHAVKPLWGMGLGQVMNLELLLRRLVDWDITFLAKFRNLYSFPVTLLVIGLCMRNTTLCCITPSIRKPILDFVRTLYPLTVPSTHTHTLTLPVMVSSATMRCSPVLSTNSLLSERFTHNFVEHTSIGTSVCGHCKGMVSYHISIALTLTHHTTHPHMHTQTHTHLHTDEGHCEL